MQRAINHRGLFVKASAAFLSLCVFPANLLASQGAALPDTPAFRNVTTMEMFTFLFLMLGPIKILGPFVQMTRGNNNEDFAKRLAIRAFVYSCLAIAFAAFIGERSMRKYHISVPVLSMAAGIILFLVALQTVMHQFDSSGAARHEYEPSMRLALSPLAFPTIVTPYGVAAVIVFMTLTPDLLARGEIFGALLGLMSLNLLAMLFAKPVLHYAGMPLQLLGTVLGIIQVALGLQIIVAGLRGLALW
jgi:small neutral amino acid transporter SnatA (MarC family)